MTVEHEVRKKVVTEVDRLKKELIKLVQEVVRIKSVNPTSDCVSYDEEIGGETAVNEYIKPIVEELGFKTDMWAEEKDRYNLVGTLKGAGEGRSLIFNGHVDVAPPDPVDQWIDKNPWSGRISEGKIWGRGAADMKGGNMAAIIAVKAIQNAGYCLNGDLIYESVVGEEMMNTEVGTGAVIKRGYTADAAIVPEPSAPPYRLGIAPASPGVLYMICTINGKTGHSSMRGELVRAGGVGEKAGVHVIDKAMIIYFGLRKLEEEWGITVPVSPPSIMAGCRVKWPGLMNKGWLFVCPAKCRLEYTIWYPPQEDKEQIKQEIEECISRWANTDGWLRNNPPKVEWVLWWPPYNVEKEAPICVTVKTAYETVTGEPAKFHGFLAVDDASFLNMVGIPAITIGPGDLTVAHAVNEYVEISELVTAVKIYALSALEWCGYQEVKGF
ncbi:MAG: ArgE/DapE family deacylase [Candidatus Odinarchaeia archaeon]